MSNPTEDRFLSKRQQREQERAEARDTSTAEEIEARTRFGASVAQFFPRIEQLLGKATDDAATDAAPADAEAPAADVDAAMSAWRVMQAEVANAVQTMRLTAHDVRTANATLARAFNEIEQARTRAATDSETSSSRFRFRRKTKPLGTSFRAAWSADALGAATDVCVVDEGAEENAISDRQGETLRLLDSSTARFARRCKGVTLAMAPVNGSCFISDCHGCKVYVACHQMRINRCSDCEFYIWCRSTPVIERSQGLRFGGYEAWSTVLSELQAASSSGGDAKRDTLEEYAQDAGIEDPTVARAAHRHVADFTWLKQQASPNWTALDTQEWTSFGAE